MIHISDKNNSEISDEESTIDYPTHKCKVCGTLFPSEYEDCPRCKELK